MRFLKYPLILLLVLVLAWVGLNFIGPKTINVERSQTINASSGVVFNLVNDLNQWASWSPWMEEDTSMVMTMGSKTEGVGGKYSWQSEVSGGGNMEIIESVKNQSVKTKLLFDGWDSPSYGTLNLKKEGNKTNLSWGMKGEGDIPWYQRGMMLVFGFKKTLEGNFEKGLSNIKHIAEERASGKYGDYTMKTTDMDQKHYVMTRSELAEKDITQFYARSLPTLYTSVAKSGAETSGMPCGLFFKHGGKGGMVDLGAAIPVSKPITLKDAISYSTPSKKAVVVDYFGDYENTGLAHESIKSYLKDNSMLYDPPYIEEYITDPGKEKDPKKWLTRITYFIAQE